LNLSLKKSKILFEESKNIEESEEERFRIALLTSRANAFKGIINRIK
jgi:hypothetical protein